LYLACLISNLNFFAKKQFSFPCCIYVLYHTRHNFIHLGASELEPLVGPEVVDTTLEELQGEEKIQHEILSKEEKPRRR
jgi:hypothetical protein